MAMDITKHQQKHLAIDTKSNPKIFVSMVITPRQNTADETIQLL
jgi:hypothetical protein